MNYNGVTEYLLQWCVEKREEYFRRNLQERADTGRSLLFVKRFFFDEMTYQVLYLVDRDFADFGAYQAAVRELIPLRKSYVLEHEKDREARPSSGKRSRSAGTMWTACGKRTGPHRSATAALFSGKNGSGWNMPYWKNGITGPNTGIPWWEAQRGKRSF